MKKKNFLVKITNMEFVFYLKESGLFNRDVSFLMRCIPEYQIAYARTANGIITLSEFAKRREDLFFPGDTNLELLYEVSEGIELYSDEVFAVKASIMASRESLQVDFTEDDSQELSLAVDAYIMERFFSPNPVQLFYTLIEDTEASKPDLIMSLN